MEYISLNWTLALKIFNWKEKENARLPNTYGAQLYFHIRYLPVPRKREISTFIQFCKTTGITCQVPYMGR